MHLLQNSASNNTKIIIHFNLTEITLYTYTRNLAQATKATASSCDSLTQQVFLVGPTGEAIKLLLLMELQQLLWLCYAVVSLHTIR